MKPVLYDLFCGAGGATKGYQDAGFYVIGVDINPQPNYCGDEFRQGDALAAIAELAAGMPRGVFGIPIDAIHASPPCQAFSLAAAGGVRRKEDHPDLIQEVREGLIRLGLPYVIENVPQAPLLDPVSLCGTSFGLPIIRHRSFECSFPFDAPWCGYKPTARVRHKDYVAYPYARKNWGPAWRSHVLPVVWPWMTCAESGQAIPPAFTRYIGEQLLDYISDEVAA